MAIDRWALSMVRSTIIKSLAASVIMISPLWADHENVSEKVKKHAEHLVTCASRGTIDETISQFRGSQGTLRYRAMHHHESDGGKTIAVMLTKGARALVLEGHVTDTEVVVMNVGTLLHDRSRWTIDDAHSGIASRENLLRLVKRLDGQPFTLVRIEHDVSKNTCAGIGVP